MNSDYEPDVITDVLVSESEQMCSHVQHLEERLRPEEELFKNQEDCLERETEALVITILHICGEQQVFVQQSSAPVRLRLDRGVTTIDPRGKLRVFLSPTSNFPAKRLGARGIQQDKRGAWCSAPGGVGNQRGKTRKLGMSRPSFTSSF